MTTKREEVRALARKALIDWGYDAVDVRIIMQLLDYAGIELCGRNEIPMPRKPPPSKSWPYTEHDWDNMLSAYTAERNEEKKG